MTVRFNVSVPDETKVDDLFLDIYRDQMSILSLGREIVHYKINEYETILVGSIMKNFIEEKPRFTDLLELYVTYMDLSSSIIALAECDDTVMRASDLVSIAEEFNNKVKDVCYQQD